MFFYLTFPCFLLLYAHILSFLFLSLPCSTPFSSFREQFIQSVSSWACFTTPLISSSHFSIFDQPASAPLSHSSLSPSLLQGRFHTVFFFPSLITLTLSLLHKSRVFLFGSKVFPHSLQAPTLHSSPPSHSFQAQYLHSGKQPSGFQAPLHENL